MQSHMRFSVLQGYPHPIIHPLINHPPDMILVRNRKDTILL